MRNKSKEDKSIKNHLKEKLNLLYDSNRIFIAIIWQNIKSVHKIIKKFQKDNKTVCTEYDILNHIEEVKEC